MNQSDWEMFRAQACLIQTGIDIEVTESVLSFYFINKTHANFQLN